MTVKVEGMKDLQRGLARLRDDLRGPVLSRAAREGADVLAETMASLAPRDSGDLADNIGVSKGETRPTRGEWNAGPSADVFYGIFQELGTVDIPAQPFMRPAADSAGDSITDAVNDVLRREVLSG